MWGCITSLSWWPQSRPQPRRGHRPVLRPAHSVQQSWVSSATGNFMICVLSYVGSGENIRGHGACELEGGSTGASLELLEARCLCLGPEAGAWPWPGRQARTPGQAYSAHLSAGQGPPVPRKVPWRWQAPSQVCRPAGLSDAAFGGVRSCCSSPKRGAGRGASRRHSTMCLAAVRIPPDRWAWLWPDRGRPARHRPLSQASPASAAAAVSGANEWS